MDAAESGDASKESIPNANHATLNPKSQLNQFLMRYTGNSTAKGDMDFQTDGDGSGSNFVSTVRLISVAHKDGVSDVPAFTGEARETQKLAEQSAAQRALDHYAAWMIANPAPPKDPNKQPKKKKRRVGEADNSSEGPSTRYGEFDLKFEAREDRGNAASTKLLNNQPAWMTKGVGVNKEIFGESKGNLVKPGMYEDDLKKLEEKAQSRDPFSEVPDPFGEAFAARNSSDNQEAALNPRQNRAPLPSQDEHFGRPSASQDAKGDKDINVWNLL